MKLLSVIPYVILIAVLWTLTWAMESDMTSKKQSTTAETKHDSSEEVVYEDDEIICFVKRDEWENPDAPHPITEMTYHTYEKKTDRELSLSELTGLDEGALANVIRRKLSGQYPRLYYDLWGDPERQLGFYAEYFWSFDPEKLDFFPGENNTIVVCDSWGLDQATNPDGEAVYVTLKRKGELE